MDSKKNYSAPILAPLISPAHTRTNATGTTHLDLYLESSSDRFHLRCKFRYNKEMKPTLITSFILLISLSAIAQLDAKQRVDLDDVQIRGEAQNRGMSVLSRTKNSLDGRITIRTNFKSEILEEVPEYFSTDKKKLAP